MASSLLVADNGINPREIALVEAVTRKRQQLDEEIETFKALKEQEFRAFETRLRKAPGEIDIGKVEASLKGIRAKIKVGKKKGRERERELEGVFTPAFLPLLGVGKEKLGSSQEAAGKSGRGSLSSRISDVEKEKASEEDEALRNEEGNVQLEKMSRDRDEQKKQETKRSAAAVARLPIDKEDARKDIWGAHLLSSSAEYRRSAMTSPPATPARPLSSSVPPEHAIDQRRLSYRSDASIEGLRSSLRTSKEPRSPKRVQFSIDDTVVSPSTSPIARRAGVPALGVKRSQPVFSKGFEKFEVVKGQREGKTSSNGVEGGDGSVSSDNAMPNPTNPADQHYAYCFRNQTGSNIPTSTGTEEPFDIVDNDEDVFEFDEVIGARGSSAPRDDIEEDPIDDDGEPEKGNGPSLTSSSPHAGSLPIEIKWGGSMRRNFKDD